MRRNATASAAPSAESPPAASASVRDRILDTATELFYQEGVRAVGVDLVVDRSGVAKTSLYRHFRTKDDLVVAFLERENADYWGHWDKIAHRPQASAGAELKAHLQRISDYIATPKYRGCPFLNVATEFPAPDHPARAVAAAHKAELRSRVGALTRQLGVARPEALADQLVLLIDGAYVNGHLLGNKGPADSLLPAALALISIAGTHAA